MSVKQNHQVRAEGTSSPAYRPGWNISMGDRTVATVELFDSELSPFYRMLQTCESGGNGKTWAARTIRVTREHGGMYP